MVRIDLRARRICRLDVVLPGDESDFGRGAAVTDVANGASAAAAMSDTPLMCCRNKLLKNLLPFL